MDWRRKEKTDDGIKSAKKGRKRRELREWGKKGGRGEEYRKKKYSELCER